MQFQRVKGTEDFYAEEQGVQDRIFSVLDSACRSRGFLHVEPPVLESFKLLSAKSGDEIKEQIFMLEKRGDEELSLRPELTPGFARMFIAKQKEMPKPVKWYTINRVWRYEAPQKGRAREFYQLNVEMYGSSRPEADAEIINLAIACLSGLGLSSKDFVIKINNRKLVFAILSQWIDPKMHDSVLRALDKAAKISPQEFDAELQKAGLTSEQIGVVKSLRISAPVNSFENLINPYCKSPEAINALDELKAVLAFVPKDFVLFDLTLVRGLAYYTGIVFEACDREGKLRSIAGGGRYDDLIATYGGDATPATGFAIGDKVLTLFLQEKGLIPKPELGPEYFVAPVDEKVFAKALEIAESLRAQGKTADIDVLGRKLAKNFEHANSIGARHVVIVGEKDLAQGQVTIRTLATGQERKVPLAELLHPKKE